MRLAGQAQEELAAPHGMRTAQRWTHGIYKEQWKHQEEPQYTRRDKGQGRKKNSERDTRDQTSYSETPSLGATGSGASSFRLSISVRVRPYSTQGLLEDLGVHPDVSGWLFGAVLQPCRFRTI